jgi:hypothetical protein
VLALLVHAEAHIVGRVHQTIALQHLPGEDARTRISTRKLTS